MLCLAAVLGAWTVQLCLRPAELGGLESLASGMPLNLGTIRGLAAMACEFDEPFILDAGKYEPAFWAPGTRRHRDGGVQRRWRGASRPIVVLAR